MNKHFIALVAAGFAALTLGASGPAIAAGQCEVSCDKAFQQCNGANPDTSACLPKWGQCKRSCNPVKAAATSARVATPAKMTKVAATSPKP